MAFDVRRAEPRRPNLIWVAAAVPALVWVVLALGVTTDAGWLRAVDGPLLAHGQELGGNGVVRAAAVALGMGFSGWTVGVVSAGLAGFAAARREHRIAAWIALSGLAELALNPLLKHLIGRPRPHPLDVAWWQTGALSFPSGHAAGAATLATVAAFLTVSLTTRGLRRRLLLSGWALLALLVAASRVMLGVHYPSDVTAGLAFGVAVPIALWALLVPQSARIPHDLAVLTGSGRKRVAVILNPTKVGDVDVFKAKVLEVATRAGWYSRRWYETTVEDPGQGQAQAALEAGVDLIVTAGGDGTVRAVCSEAARTGVAVGIIPLGTGNLLARNMGLPLNLREALEVAFGGQDKAIDLATFTTDATFDTAEDTDAEADETPDDQAADAEPKLTETTFLVMAGLGMDAEIMLGVDDNLKQRVGWFAYFLSGVKALRFPTMRVRISVDDGPFHKFRARTVVIGNVGFLQAGIPLLPEARLDDGLLDVVVLAPKRFIGWVAILVRVMGRTQRTDRALNRMTGRRIVVRCDAPAPMQLDGDPVGLGTRLEADVHHGVLLVRVPVAPPAPD